MLTLKEQFIKDLEINEGKNLTTFEMLQLENEEIYNECLVGKVNFEELSNLFNSNFDDNLLGHFGDNVMTRIEGWKFEDIEGE